jgi:hypothetical protein
MCHAFSWNDLTWSANFLCWCIKSTTQYDRNSRVKIPPSLLNQRAQLIILYQITVRFSYVHQYATLFSISSRSLFHTCFGSEREWTNRKQCCILTDIRKAKQLFSECSRMLKYNIILYYGGHRGENLRSQRAWAGYQQLRILWKSLRPTLPFTCKTELERKCNSYNLQWSLHFNKHFLPFN